MGMGFQMKIPIIHYGFKTFGRIFVQKVGARDSQFNLRMFFNWVAQPSYREWATKAYFNFAVWWLAWKKSRRLVRWMQFQWVSTVGRTNPLYHLMHLPSGTSSSTSYLFWIDADGECFSDYYCWWKKSQTTTWDVSNLVNNGINYQPQLVDAGFLNHQSYHPNCFSNSEFLGYSSAARQKSGMNGCKKPLKRTIQCGSSEKMEAIFTNSWMIGWTNRSDFASNRGEPKSWKP